MALIGLDISYIVSQVAQAISSLRLEISIFLAAFIAHAVLFGKYSVRLRPQQVYGKEKAKTIAGGPRREPAPPRAKVSALTSEDICKGCTGRPEAAVANLRYRLKEASAESVSPALLSLLQGAGRSPPVELLAAVAAVAEERSLPLNSALGAGLLRGHYVGQKAESESLLKFDSLLAKIEEEAAGDRLADAVGVQALKSTLRKGDFEASLKRLEGLNSMLEMGQDSTPSSAPKTLLQWLARLALQQDRVPGLVAKLRSLGLLAEAFPLILTECAQCGNTDVMREIEALARKEELKFNDAAYCVLLKGASELERASGLFAEAADSVGVSKELVVAAAAAASAHRSLAFADAILKKLPVDTPTEAAGKLIQLYAGAKADDTEVIKLYLQHFASNDLSGDPATEQLIVEACIRQNRVDTVKKMLSTADCTKRVALIKHLGAAGKLDNVFVVFRNIPDPGACIYNAVIDVCIDGQQPEAARDVINDAIQAHVADTVTYNTTIKAHLLAGSTTDAWKTVKLMSEAGLEPNAVTFNELLDACIKFKVGEVWPILDEMKARGVKPNQITGSILLKTITGNTSAATIELVLEILGSIMAEGMDEVLLSSVVEACIRAGRVDLLLPHLKRQTSSKRILVQGPHTYGSIIRAYGFVNDVAGAWETWRDMRQRRIVPTAVTLGCMVEAVVSNGDPEAGYQLIQDMLNDAECQPLVNAVIYCSVLKGFSHKKNFGRLWAVYEEMLMQKVQFSIVTFNTMVDACSRCGEMRRISGLLQSMMSQGIEPNIITYSAILKGYCQENRLHEAFELMEEVKRATKFKPDEIMYNTILDGCARQGLYQRAMPLLADMEAAGVNPSNFTLSVLVKLCSRAKRLDRAFEIVQEISSKYHLRPNVHVYGNLIQACIQHSDLRRAYEVLERLMSERIRPDVRVYTLLLRACMSAGEAQDAAGLIRAAVGLRGVHPRLTGYAASALQPQGGLPPALLGEVIEGLSVVCGEETLAMTLFKDVRSKHVKLDPKLQMRITRQAVGKPRQASHQTW